MYLSCVLKDYCVCLFFFFLKSFHLDLMGVCVCVGLHLGFICKIFGT